MKNYLWSLPRERVWKYTLLNFQPIPLASWSQIQKGIFLDPWPPDLKSRSVYFQILVLYFRLLFFFLGPLLLYTYGFHRFQAFFCVRLFSTCSINTIKRIKSMVPMPTTSFLNHYFLQEHTSPGLYIHRRKGKHQCFSRPFSPALNHHQPLMAHLYQELTFVPFWRQWPDSCPNRKYVHMSKINEMGSKHIFSSSNRYYN